MRRIVLVLEVMEDEADQVVEAVSATGVTFQGLKLNDAVHALLSAVPAPDEHGDAAHHFTSDGVQGRTPAAVICNF